jgi:hypothetical protein
VSPEEIIKLIESCKPKKAVELTKLAILAICISIPCVTNRLLETGTIPTCMTFAIATLIYKDKKPKPTDKYTDYRIYYNFWKPCTNGYIFLLNQFGFSVPSHHN